mmetsp:Transcript_9350/g.15779  ORF Transcript_9350/g.15779 Transcript_9350/m.15779 type:complete len:97 (+) Transcript_9350:518-808(+)
MANAGAEALKNPNQQPPQHHDGPIAMDKSGMSKEEVKMKQDMAQKYGSSNQNRKGEESIFNIGAKAQGKTADIEPIEKLKEKSVQELEAILDSYKA